MESLPSERAVLLRAIEDSRDDEEFDKAGKFHAQILRYLVYPCLGREVHVFRPSADDIREAIGIIGHAYALMIRAIGVRMHVSAVPAFTANDIRTVRHPVAHLEFLAAVLYLAALPVHLNDNTAVLVTMDGRKYHILFGFRPAVKQGFALEGMFVGTANPRHFHLHDAGARFQMVGIRKIPHF